MSPNNKHCQQPQPLPIDEHVGDASTKPRQPGAADGYLPADPMNRWCILATQSLASSFCLKHVTLGWHLAQGRLAIKFITSCPVYGPRTENPNWLPTSDPRGSNSFSRTSSQATSTALFRYRRTSSTLPMSKQLWTAFLGSTSNTHQQLDFPTSASTIGLAGDLTSPPTKAAFAQCPRLGSRTPKCRSQTIRML